MKTNDNGIRVDLKYKQDVEMEDDGSEQETKTSFKIWFADLIEYVKKSTEDTNGTDGSSDENVNMAYDWEQDEVVQTIPLTAWGDINGVIDDDEGIISYFTAHTSLGDVGSILFNFTLTRQDQADSLLTANSMKIDVKIVDFPWTRTDSYLALLTTVDSKTKVKMEYDEEATVVTNNDGNSKKTKDVGKFQETLVEAM